MIDYGRRWLQHAHLMTHVRWKTKWQHSISVCPAAHLSAERWLPSAGGRVWQGGISSPEEFQASQNHLGWRSPLPGPINTAAKGPVPVSFEHLNLSDAVMKPPSQQYCCLRGGLHYSTGSPSAFESRQELRSNRTTGRVLGASFPK